MSRFIPMPAYTDSMPVDISFVFEDEKPAGKHGFVYADGEDLRFEDGTLAKFWGVNFNGGACFPSHEYSHKVAPRLAQAGCNIVRFHQLDAEWDTPNLFAWSKGRRVTTTRKLDPKSLDALDYLVHCLKEEGIYCYLDMLTYRKFKEGDDVVDPQMLQDSAKPWSITNPRLIELQKEYCTQLWTHVNPYTGLAYKDDPVFVLTEITNECDLFQDFAGVKYDHVPETYYINEFRQMFRDWLQEKGLEGDWENIPLYAPDENFVRFKYDVTKKYYKEMYDHMRSIGVKIPITGTNWSCLVTGFLKSHEDLDYTDSHHYYYDWGWGNTERVCKNFSITSSPIAFPNMPKLRLDNKPFFVSEWDMPWPNSYRAEGAIYYAAVGALQGWSGFTIHTYSYSTRLDKIDIMGRELTTPVAGIPYREGIFSTWNDPAKFGLFYHAALMVRRCDITKANKKVAVYSPDFTKAHTTSLNGLLEQHQAVTVFEDKLPEGYDELVLDSAEYPHPVPGKIMSDNGQMWRDLNLQIGGIDTARTKILYGFLGRGNNGSSHRKPLNRSFEVDGMSVLSRTDFAVVALSSLTDAPIEESDNMLLTTIGRAHNTDQVFDGEKLLDLGRAPIVAEVIDADIKIRVKGGERLKVWGINAEGFYAGKMATTYEDGILSFSVGNKDNPACYYLIVRE